MFKTVRMSVDEAYKACNVNLNIDLSNLKPEKLAKAIDRYRDENNLFNIKKEEYFKSKGKSFTDHKLWDIVLFLNNDDLKRITTSSAYFDFFDPATKVDILERGFYGTFMGVAVYGDKPDAISYTILKTELLASREPTGKERLQGLLNSMDDFGSINTDAFFELV